MLNIFRIRVLPYSERGFFSVPKLSVTDFYTMMTSSNGNIFRVTGPLCGEFTGPGEFPTQRPVTRSFDIFFDLRLNKRLSKHSWGWWFETLSWSLWRHHNAASIHPIVAQLISHKIPIVKIVYVLLTRCLVIECHITILLLCWYCYSSRVLSILCSEMIRPGTHFTKCVWDHNSNLVKMPRSGHRSAHVLTAHRMWQTCYLI